VVLSPAGRIAEDTWGSISTRFPGTELDAYVVMPNHLHGIIVLPNRPDDHPSRIHVGRIVRAFKGAATHAIRHRGLREFAWQADYYEHVIRNDRDLNRIRDYILTNQFRWSLDRANPDAVTRQG
jgi:REP element-mobilizing transposase RayT